MTRTALTLALLCTLAPSAARARPVSGTTETLSISSGADVRSLSHDWLILADGKRTLGAGLRFAMADGGLSDRPIQFTDLAFLDLNGRLSLGGKGELFASAVLLPKQPSDAGERIWQGSALGARVGFAERFALQLLGQVGPLMSQPGLWSSTELKVETRYSIDQSLFFQAELGGGATGLHRPGAPFWFAEVLGGGDVVFRAPRIMAVWVGAQVRVPIGLTPSDELFPKTRLNFRAGSSLTFVKEWDIYAELVFIDRGDLAVPGTTLPILDGGFDQRVITLGITRRFGEEARQSRDYDE